MLVSCGEISILSDPWYSGDAFHKGWNLLHETSDQEARKLLGKTTHIWLSHEHPDHFSVKFFKVFKNEIINNKIIVLFQKTHDQRVVNFLRANEIKYQEISFDRHTKLAHSISVTCIKDGFYDSALLIQNGSEKILNLNDCEINNKKRVLEVKKITGEVDVLLTQFSYAAWKGGRKNVSWRKKAAKEKLDTVKLQASVFKPAYLIPFASYIYFSNHENFYLNDASNSPGDVLDLFSEEDINVCIMQPQDVLGGADENLNIIKAKEFWDSKYRDIHETKLNQYDLVDLTDLKKAFYEYADRIRQNNSYVVMQLLKIVSPVRVFQSVEIFLTDLNVSVKFDYLKNEFNVVKQDFPMLSMRSESLYFVFKNSFGFDTLTVNGCFEEERANGFVTATKTLAIENLNNLGIRVKLGTLFNFYIIKLFLTRLYRVTRNLD